MRKVEELQSAEYRALLVDFAEWLEVLGYAGRSIQNRISYVRQLLVWLEQYRSRKQQIETLSTEELTCYIQYLKQRPSARGGAISAAHINAAHSSLSLFAKFLRLQHQVDVHVVVAREVLPQQHYRVLSRREVISLYHVQQEEAYQLRDCAILSVLYGAALRLGEAQSLHIGDVDTKRSVLHVRRGKGGKSRMVPLVGRAKQDIEQYLHEARRWFVCSGSHGRGSASGASGASLFVSISGTALGRAGIALRLQRLSELAELPLRVRPHDLRHAIATHLLQAGMPLQSIAIFLGHSSLASTQIYTHILEQNKTGVQHAGF